MMKIRMIARYQCKLVEKARECFDEAALPADVEAVWWPRFRMLAGGIIDWEIPRAVAQRIAEARAERTEIGVSGVVLSGVADRIDVLEDGSAEILDFKTGSSPSKAQAHTLLSPQLALEGALLRRGAFRDAGSLSPTRAPGRPRSPGYDGLLRSK